MNLSRKEFLRTSAGFVSAFYFRDLYSQVKETGFAFPLDRRGIQSTVRDMDRFGQTRDFTGTGREIFRAGMDAEEYLDHFLELLRKKTEVDCLSPPSSPWSVREAVAYARAFDSVLSLLSGFLNKLWANQIQREFLHDALDTDDLTPLVLNFLNRINSALSCLNEDVILMLGSAGSFKLQNGGINSLQTILMLESHDLRSLRSAANETFRKRMALKSLHSSASILDLYNEHLKTLPMEKEEMDGDIVVSGGRQFAGKIFYALWFAELCLRRIQTTIQEGRCGAFNSEDRGDYFQEENKELILTLDFIFRAASFAGRKLFDGGFSKNPAHLRTENGEKRILLPELNGERADLMRHDGSILTISSFMFNEDALGVVANSLEILGRARQKIRESTR